MDGQMNGTEEYVWYACYGSNLNADRFGIYIAGGSLEIGGHTVTEKGSRDRRPPRSSEVGRIPYRLVFAGQFAKWENKSAAFLDMTHRDHNLQTVCRMYKITAEQFTDVVAQENGGIAPADFRMDDLRKKGYLDLYPELPYGRLVYVEEREGLPVLTFTCPEGWKGGAAGFTAPSEPYLEVIRSGLCECGFSRGDADRYLRARVPDENDLAVVPTDVRHRRHAGNDYVIGMNSRTKRLYGIGSAAVVKHLVENERESGDLEWRTLTAYGKTVVDDSLPDGTVALDQTIRNAIGLPYRSTKGHRVRLASLRRNLFQRIADRLRPGQRLIMRVNMASPQDMEKNNCRVSENALTLMHAREGENIRIERCVPDMPDTASVPGLSGDERRSARDAREFAEWTSCGSYSLRSIRIRAYCTDDKIEDAIAAAREKSEEDGTSFSGLYPDAEKILKLENDLETIRLDKYYRDLAGADVLDTVKVKRCLSDRLAAESIDFGLVFVLTVFAAIMALNQDNIGYLPAALGISAIAAVVLTLIKTK